MTQNNNENTSDASKNYQRLIKKLEQLCKKITASAKAARNTTDQAWQELENATGKTKAELLAEEDTHPEQRSLMALVKKDIKKAMSFGAEALQHYHGPFPAPPPTTTIATEKKAEKEEVLSV